MRLWVHFLSGSLLTLTIGWFVFLFPEVGICAKFCGASACFSNEQYLCSTVRKIGKLLKECSVISGDSPELLTASMCQPLLFLLTPFSWSYAQEQQFIEQSLLKGSYFSNISYVFSRDFNVGMPWFKLRFLAFSEYIFAQFIFYLILDTDVTEWVHSYCRTLSRAQVSDTQSISTHSIKPRPQARLPLSEQAAFHFSHGWTFFFFFSEIYKSIFRKCYVCL